MTTRITPDELDFSDATKVISSAQKFVIPVPAFPAGGEPLVYPEGTKDKDGQSIAGKPITDWQGNPIGDAGIVFFNAKDKAWQAAPGDGNAVIIINNVTEEQATSLNTLVRSLQRPNLGFSVNELKMVLSNAHSMGLGDMYNSDKGFIASKMTRVGNDTGVEAYGLHKRDDRDICEAVYVTGNGEFQGPAATAQQFEDGAIILRQGKDVRLIQSDVFEKTYRNVDGTPLKIEEIASVITRGGVTGPTRKGPSTELKK